MKRLFLCLISILFWTSLNAQVSNVEFQVRDDNTIEITYSLSHLSNILISASVDGGDSHYISNLSGDFGYNIEPGHRKSVIWDVLKSYPAGLRTDNLVINVNATSVATADERRKVDSRERSREWWGKGQVNVVGAATYNFYAHRFMYGGRIDINDKSNTVGMYGKFLSTFNDKPENFYNLEEKEFKNFEVDYFKALSVTLGFQIGTYKNLLGFQWWLGAGYGQRDYFARFGNDFIRNSSRSIKSIDCETGITFSLTRLVFNIGINLPLSLDNDLYYKDSVSNLTPELEFGVGFRF